MKQRNKNICLKSFLLLNLEKFTALYSIIYVFNLLR